ncbi:hypothetical protein AGIG_G10180 [Arapaima gigas]
MAGHGWGICFSLRSAAEKMPDSKVFTAAFQGEAYGRNSHSYLKGPKVNVTIKAELGVIYIFVRYPPEPIPQPLGTTFEWLIQRRKRWEKRLRV